MLFKPQLGDPTRYHRINILNLDKLTLRSNALSIGAAGDRLPSKKFFYASTVTAKEFFYFSERDQETCDLNGEV